MSCPDANTLNAFVGRLSTEDERSSVEAHLDGCRDCVEIVTALAAALGESSGPTAPAQDKDEPASAPTVARGTRIGRYTVLEMLGQGGMGTVYLAHDSDLDRKVALKLFRPGKVSEQRRQRMANEARLMAQIVHPNIVTIFDVGTVEERMYIVMELVEGGTLATWLRGGTRARSSDEILEVFLVAGRALAVSHAAGIVHRDFKPENVLLGAGGRVAVSDFGIATTTEGAVAPALAHDGDAAPALATGTTPARLTRDGDRLGTPAYMSPELHRGESAGPRSDQFSFAVALYEALHGEAPFEGATFEARREAVLAGKLRTPSSAALARIPSALRRVLARALSADPLERYPSMSALLVEIERARRAPRRSRLVLLALGSALAVVAVVFAGAAARRRAGALAEEHAPSVVPDAAAPATATLASRTAVFVVPLDNRTGDARFDGVVEAGIASMLNTSKHLDAHRVASLKQVSDRLEVGSTDRGGVLVQGSLVLDDDAVAISLVASDLVTRRVVAELHEAAPARDPIVASLASLSLRLRAALGDPRLAGEEPLPRLSASLVALHDWASGSALINAGSHEAAIPPLERAVAADPAFAEAHASLGLAEYNVMDEPAANEQIQLALRDGNALGQRRRLELLGLAYAAQDRPSESMTAREELLTLWPHDLETEISLAGTATRAREFPLALELSRRTMANHPGSAMAGVNLGAALVATGDFAAVVTQGESILASSARPPLYAFVQVAIAYALLGERDHALATYDRLAKVDEEFADEGRADLAMYEGRLDDAEALLRRQVDAAIADGDPTEARTEYRSLALCRLRRGDKPGARRAALAAVGKTSVVLQYSVAHSLIESGSDEEAIKLVATWSDSASAIWRSYAKLLAGDLKLAHGKSGEAIDSYRAARSLHDEWRAHERLGQAYLAHGDDELAETEFAACVDRRGEGALLETPSLQYLNDATEGLARARAARGAAASRH